MNIRIVLLFASLTALRAADLDPRLLRLIGPDAKFVAAIDLERFQASKFSALMAHETVTDAPLRFAMEIGVAKGQTLTVTVASAPASDPEADEPPVLYRGARIWKNNDYLSYARLSSFELRGDPKSITAAIDRWHSAEPPGPLAATVRRLSNSYDAWFVMTKPLDLPDLAGGTTRSPRVEEFAQAIDEVRGGIRFGSIADVTVEADCKSSDEASALAV